MANRLDAPYLGINAGILMDALEDADIVERIATEREYGIANLGRAASGLAVGDLYNFSIGIMEAEASFRRQLHYTREIARRLEAKNGEPKND